MALAQGFTHVLTLDADGQHNAADIPRMMAISAARPDAMVLGRPIFDASAPAVRVAGRRVANLLANIETLWAGIGDSLFGFRVYPIVPLLRAFRATRWMRRFDFDPEAAIRLCWMGVPPVNFATQVRYFRPDEGGVSHFRYLRDNLLLSFMFLRLLAEMPRAGVAASGRGGSDHPAVDRDDLRRDVAGLLRRQELHQLGYLLGGAGPLHRHQPVDLLRPERLVGHRRGDDAGGDGVDGDAAAGEFQRQRAGCAVQPGFGGGVVGLAAIAGDRATEEILMIRPQRRRIIGISSGWVTLKKPLSETSITPVHCPGRIAGITASSWMPALLTRISIGPSASTRSSAASAACGSVMSNTATAAEPPCARIPATTASACAMPAWAWT